MFTSARAEKNAGDWAGLLVYDNSILRHCVIEYAGGDYTISGYTRALTLGGTAIIEDCLIQESSGTGMEISGGSATIRNNIIKNCADMGIEIGIQYHQIVDASNTMENTGGFDITGGGGLNTDVTLTKRTYPYVLSGTGIFADATLTIEPGTAIQMRSGSSISMGWNNVSNTYSGNLVAKGTADQPITFSLYTKDKEAGKGNWGFPVLRGEQLHFCAELLYVYRRWRSSQRISENLFRRSYHQLLPNQWLPDYHKLHDIQLGDVRNGADRWRNGKRIKQRVHKQCER